MTAPMVPTTTPSINVTPGVKTSEGRLTIATTIVGIVVMLVTIIHPGFKIDDQTKRNITAMLSIFVPAMVAAYQWARSKVKIAALQSIAQIVATQLAAQAQATQYAPPASPALSAEPHAVGKAAGATRKAGTAEHHG